MTVKEAVVEVLLLIRIYDRITAQMLYAAIKNVEMAHNVTFNSEDTAEIGYLVSLFCNHKLPTIDKP